MELTFNEAVNLALEYQEQYKEKLRNGSKPKLTKHWNCYFCDGIMGRSYEDAYDKWFAKYGEYTKETSEAASGEIVKLTLHELKLSILVWANVYPDYRNLSLNDLLMRLRHVNQDRYNLYMDHYSVFIKNYYLNGGVK